MTTANKETIIDIGANLTNKVFSADLDAVISRARQQAISHILVTGTDLHSSEQAVKLAEQYPDYLFATAGIHPHDASSYSAATHATLRSLCQLPAVKAIGETGLDFNRNYSTPAQQINAFEQQLALACETGLPLFLHERDAHDKQWQMLHSHRDDISRVVIHCFTGTKQQAFRYLDLDCYLGITGWICDERRGYHLHEFIADIPLQRLMIETDAPYLVPRVKPKPLLVTSRRNEPCTLPYVLETVARHRQQTPQQVARATTANAIGFFNL